MTPLWFPGPVLLQVGVGRLEAAARDKLSEVEERVKASVDHETAMDWCKELARCHFTGSVSSRGGGSSRLTQ